MILSLLSFPLGGGGGYSADPPPPRPRPHTLDHVAVVGFAPARRACGASVVEVMAQVLDAGGGDEAHAQAPDPEQCPRGRPAGARHLGAEESESEDQGNEQRHQQRQDPQQHLHVPEVALKHVPDARRRRQDEQLEGDLGITGLPLPRRSPAEPVMRSGGKDRVQRDCDESGAGRGTHTALWHLHAAL